MLRRSWEWLALASVLTACSSERTQFEKQAVADAGGSDQAQDDATSSGDDANTADGGDNPSLTDPSTADASTSPPGTGTSTSTTAPPASTPPPPGMTGTAPTATTPTDGGMPIEPPPPSCTPECEDSATVCVDGAFSVCEQRAECWVWSEPTACGSGSCQDEEQCAGCSNECAGGSTQCAAGLLTSCITDASGCLMWAESPEACQTGQCADETACLSCDDECEAGQLRCTNGTLETCIDSDLGCTTWGAPETCASCDAPAGIDPVSPLRGSYTGSVHAPSTRAALRPTLKWTAASPTCGELSYHVQMDDSCDAGELEGCDFDSPEVDTTVDANEFEPADDLNVAESAPVGALYAWRVRACAYGSACSEWSNVSYLHVGRTAQDYDGDGYADVVLNGSDTDGYSAQVYNGAANFNSGADVRIALPYYVDSSGFGMRSAGDIDADGYADLVVVETATDECSSSGLNIGVVYGGDDLSAPRIEHLCRTAGSPSVMFRVAAAGDLNGDGFADVAVARDLGSIENSIYVLAGGPSLSPTPVAEMDTNTGATYLHTSTAGLSLAGYADFNGDSYPDFMASASGVTEHTVTQRLYLGGPDFATDFADDFTSDECRNNDYLMALGDVTGDGFDDWALSCSGDDDYTFGLIAGRESLEPSLTGVAHYSARMSGISPALDFDNDGTLDVFLGQEGAAFIWNDAGFNPATADTFSDLTSAKLMAVADHDGDGRQDIAWFTATGNGSWVGSYSSFNVVPVQLQPPADFEATSLGF